MEITILGSGGYIPTKQQFSSSYLIKSDNDFILLDCGCGAVKRLLDLKFAWQKINHIFISHTHIDHINDLFVIIHSQVVNRKKTLHIYGPGNIEKIGQFIKKEMSKSCAPPRFQFHGITNNRIKINKLTVKNQSINHDPVIPTLAYKFQLGNKILVYSGDLGPKISNTEFIRFAKNVNLLIADSGSRPGQKRSGHLSPAEVGKLAQSANVKKLVLTHQTVTSEKIIINDCKKYYTGPVVVAKDLMKIKL